MKPKHFRYLWKFYKDKKQWLDQGGKITRSARILSDYADSAGTVKGHYFHQDLWIAKPIRDHNPNCHFDKGPPGPRLLPYVEPVTTRP